MCVEKRRERRNGWTGNSGSVGRNAREEREKETAREVNIGEAILNGEPSFHCGGLHCEILYPTAESVFSSFFPFSSLSLRLNIHAYGIAGLVLNAE